MTFDIGNLQVALWQTEEAIDAKCRALETEDDAALSAVLLRSLAGLESLLAIQRRTLDFLVRGKAAGAPAGDSADALRQTLTAGSDRLAPANRQP